jgi:hypothetical protein
MTSNIFEYSNINEKLQNEIKEYINKSDKEFNTSLLYDPKEEKKIIDTNVRNSEFRLFTDNELFQKIEDLLKDINEKNKYYNFLLVRNDITNIKYKEGQYFKEHEDYLGFHSNFITEFTMIMCLDANCEGGRTIIHFNPDFKYKCEATITPNNILIFRKDLIHEGEILKSGYKDIITLNLIATEKENDINRLVLLKSTEGNRYLIPLTKIMSFQNTLSDMLDATKDNNEHLIELDSEFNNKELEVIYNIFMGYKINPDDYKNYKHVIEFYGISINEVIISLSNNENLLDLSIQKYKLDKHIYICKNKAETEYWMNEYKNEGYNAHSFRLIFIENNSIFVQDGGDNYEKLDKYIEDNYDKEIKPNNKLKMVYKEVDNRLFNITSCRNSEINYYGLVESDKHYINSLFDRLNHSTEYLTIEFDKKMSLEQRKLYINYKYCSCIQKDIIYTKQNGELIDYEEYDINDGDIKNFLKNKHSMYCQYYDTNKISDKIDDCLIKEQLISGEIGIYSTQHLKVDQFLCNESIYGTMNAITVNGIYVE